MSLTNQILHFVIEYSEVLSPCEGINNPFIVLLFIVYSTTQNCKPTLQQFELIFQDSLLIVMNELFRLFI